VRHEDEIRLITVLQDLAGLDSRCDDGGRLARIQKAITVTLTTLDTIRAAKKESLATEPRCAGVPPRSET
jgi:hypothetical protein